MVAAIAASAVVAASPGLLCAECAAGPIAAGHLVLASAADQLGEGSGGGYESLESLTT